MSNSTSPSRTPLAVEVSGFFMDQMAEPRNRELFADSFAEVDRRLGQLFDGNLEGLLRKSVVLLPAGKVTMALSVDLDSEAGTARVSVMDLSVFPSGRPE